MSAATAENRSVKIVFEILTFTLIAVVLLSWVHVAINGRTSGPSSWNEYYEGSR